MHVSDNIVKWWVLFQDSSTQSKSEDITTWEKEAVRLESTILVLVLLLGVKMQMRTGTKVTGERNRVTAGQNHFSKHLCKKSWSCHETKMPWPIQLTSCTGSQSEHRAVRNGMEKKKTKETLFLHHIQFIKAWMRLWYRIGRLVFFFPLKSHCCKKGFPKSQSLLNRAVPAWVSCQLATLIVPFFLAALCHTSWKTTAVFIQIAVSWWLDDRLIWRNFECDCPAGISAEHHTIAFEWHKSLERLPCFWQAGRLPLSG